MQIAKIWNRPLTRQEMKLWCASLAVALVLCGGTQAAHWVRVQLDTGEAVCADTLRLHIRAKSDSAADQADKLAVRDAVLAYMDAACTAQDKAAALAWAQSHLGTLARVARHTLAARGADTTVRVYLVNMYFDTTHYADASLPAGRYDAVRIDLGDTEQYGHNWWCVLYPGLCRSACGGYDTPEENDLVCGDYIVRFRIVELWNRCTASRAEHLLSDK